MESEASSTRDPVCGMEVKRQNAAAATEYQGQMFFFCRVECKNQFDENPERYAKTG